MTWPAEAAPAPQSHEPPDAQDLAVVVAYFNPCGFASRRANLRATLGALERQGVRAYVAELAFGDRRPDLTASDHVLHLRGHDVLWHKEALLNAAVRALPDGYSKIAWIDADIVFEHGSWYLRASAALDEVALIQPYAVARHLGPDGATLTMRPSLAARAAGDRGDPFDFSTSHPGLAWAARREFLEAFPLLDRMVVGGADLLMGLAAFGCRDHAYLRRLPHVMRSYYRSYETAVHDRIRGRVGHVGATIRHLWHGSARSRRYVERLDILDAHSFDPHLDVEPDRHGVLRWASDKEGLHRDVRAYFTARREDATR